jgi:SAM-dependent methyltransferase
MKGVENSEHASRGLTCVPRCLVQGQAAKESSMLHFRGLVERRREPEDIDDPGLEDRRHRAALDGLARINLLSRSAAILWSPMARLARELGTERLRVLDIATGAGDVPLGLWQKALRSGLALEIHGIDVSERAVALARQRADACRAPLTFSRLDVLAEPLPADCDVVMSSLFLHHLSQEQAAALLQAMARSAGRLVLVNDLRRSAGGLILAWLAGRLLTRSPVVRVDAMRSVRAAFTIAEARQLAAISGLVGARVERRWPCRFLLEWRHAPIP